MSSDRRFWIVIAASLVWGLLVAGFFQRITARAGARRDAEKSLVVAARALPFGTVIGRDAVKLRSVPEDLFPAGGAARIEDVLDRPVISPIQENEPVVEARLAGRGSGSGLAPLIPSGMRAIAVRVNDVVGVAGFVLPGMRVDVLVTGRPPGRADTYTRTVLQDVTVLSAGQAVQTDGKNLSMNVPVVTLLVNPAQAEALALANSEGHIQLVLRNSSDQKIAGTPGSQTQELFAARAEVPAPLSAPAPAPEPKPHRKAAGARVARVAPPPAPIAPAAPRIVDQVVLIRGNIKTVETAPARPKERP